jgi:hypothetical protein
MSDKGFHLHSPQTSATIPIMLFLSLMSYLIVCCIKGLEVVLYMFTYAIQNIFLRAGARKFNYLRIFPFLRQGTEEYIPYAF